MPSATIDRIPETLLQRAAQRLLTDVDRTWTSTSGECLTFLAVGLLNVHAGPDYRDMAVLVGGHVYVGDGEFHRRASEWVRHGHPADGRYRDLMVHVVADDDGDRSAARWTVVVDAADLCRQVSAVRRAVPEEDGVAVDELQRYAFRRLLRTTATADLHRRRCGVAEAARIMAADWCRRLEGRRHRPRALVDADLLRGHLVSSALGRWLVALPSIPPAELADELRSAERQRIASEGLHLRRELVINVVLPMALSIATDGQRRMLMDWYWTTRAVHHYGFLRRLVPGNSQRWVWQQQGLLEYLRDHGPRITTCADVAQGYGLRRTLRFLELVGR